MGLLWNPPDPGRRGPKPALSLDRIVATAVEIADRDGLAALSMSRLAGELGFTTMSLYRYVPSKDDLVVLMINHVAGRPPAHPEARGWRERLELWNADQVSVLMRHTWRTLVPISGPPLTPNELAWLDAALDALHETSLTETEKFATVQALATISLSQVRLITEIRAAAQSGAADPMPFEARLAALITPAEYPAIHRSLVGDDRTVEFATATEPPDPLEDPDFLFGVHRLLDGIESYIAAKHVRT